MIGVNIKLDLFLIFLILVTQQGINLYKFTLFTAQFKSQ